MYTLFENLAKPSLKFLCNVSSIDILNDIQFLFLLIMVVIGDWINIDDFLSIKNKNYAEIINKSWGHNHKGNDGN